MLASITFDAGIIRVIGTSGDDTFVIGNFNDVSTDISVNNGQPGSIARRFLNDQIDEIIVIAGAGDDLINGGESIDNLFGNSGDDTLYGGAGNDRIYGQDGDDILVVGSGNDRLVAGNGDDFLNGGSQADSLWGDSGDDIFTAHEFDNFVDLNSPEDRFEFDPPATSFFTHVYDDGTIDVYGTEGDDEIKFFEDRITINSDTVTLDVAQAPVVRAFGRGGNDDVFEGHVIVQGPSYQLSGGDGDDYLRLSGAGGKLEGGTGNDRLVGRAGARYVFAGEADLGLDVLAQNSGVGELDFSGLDLQTGINVDLDARTTQTVARNTDDNRKLAVLLSGLQPNFKFVIGTQYDDTISGIFRIAEGKEGNDTYRTFGLSSSASIVEIAGEGYDTVDFSSSSQGLTADLSQLNDASIEHVIGSAFGDVLINNRFTKVLQAGAGNDTYRFSPTAVNAQAIRIEEAPSAGIDTADYSDLLSAVDIDLRRFPEVENLIGTDFEDRLIGNAQDNQILGGLGGDFIEGREGTDDLQGQHGTDIYNVIPGEELDVTDVITDEGTSVVLPEVDNDGDGLLPSEEVTIGTNPDQFDSDGDLLGDGFENNSDSLDPNTVNDPHGDSDGDGLSELDEQIYETNPDNSDTDGDGTSDFDEIEQGGDPTDDSDEGEPPADEDIVKLNLKIGDHSGSHSERYDLSIGRIHHQAPEFGVVETDEYSFERGNVFDIRIYHRGSNLDTPDYDYTAEILSGDEMEGLAIVEDPNEIIRIDDTSSFFFAQGKTAKLYLPKVDLDVHHHPDGSLVAEEDERDIAKTGFLFPRSETDGVETELTKLTLQKVTAGLAGITTIVFDASKVRVWKDPQRSESVSSGVTEFDPDQVHTLYVESILSAEEYRNLQIKAVYRPTDIPENGFAVGEKAEDVVSLRAIKSDLDIGLHDEAVLSEAAEDNPGIRIDLGADKDELARLNILSLFPDTLTAYFGFFTLDFDDTILKLWSHVEDKVGLDAFEEVTTDTVFEEAEQSHSVWVEGFEMGATTISLIWNSTNFSDDVSMVLFDSVKINTFGKRDVDILAAVGGTGSGPWLSHEYFPNNEAKTKSVDENGDGRWLSHLKNWEAEHGDGDEDIAKYFPGPGTFGFNVSEIRDQVYTWVSTQYWEAIRDGAEPKVDLLGMSRGGMIANEVAWKISNEGYEKTDITLTSDFEDEIRFLGLYDPVDQSAYNSYADIAPIVNWSVVAYATNFQGGDSNDVSRHYWTRLPYLNSSTPRKPFAATHSAIQGAPTYSTDGGSLFSSNGHPITWLPGYTSTRDIVGSEEVDTWVRDQARSKFVPINVVNDYLFSELWPSPYTGNPSHDPNFDWDGDGELE